MSVPVQLGTAWALLLLGLYLLCHRWTTARVPSPTQAIVIVFAIALVVRLVPNVVLPMGAGYDIESYALVGDLVRRGQEVYGDAATLKRHPYLPLLMYWMAGARVLAEGLGVPFVHVVRLLPIVADAVIAICLVTAVQRRTQSLQTGAQAGLLYALNPVPVMVAAYHGQLDAIPALAMLLSVLLMPAMPLVAGLVLGTGILSKSWPVLILPVLLAGVSTIRDRAKVLGGSIIVPGLGVAVYALLFRADMAVVVERALGYNWGVGIWGYTYLVRMIDSYVIGGQAVFQWFVRNGRFITLGGLALIWLLKARRESIAAGALTILIAFFALTHAFSIQYLMWLVPLALLNGERRWLAAYTCAAFVYMLLTYTTLILEMHVTRFLPLPLADYLIIIPASLPAWIVSVAWLIRRLRQPVETVTISRQQIQLGPSLR